MTLQEIRDLWNFVRRLGKCQLLLRREDDGGEAPLDWTAVNQYDIVDLVIKRVIPSGRGCSYSWSELAAARTGREGLEPRFFVSHWFGESAREFMASIEHHATQHRVRWDDTYWFCVCANDQHNVNLDMPLNESPFFHALQQPSCEHTLVMLDREGKVRGRLWCVYEWAETIAMGKSLEVGTCLGLVGTPLVASGPYVDYMRGLNSECAKATLDADAKKIQGHIEATWRDGFKTVDDEVKDHVEKQLAKRVVGGGGCSRTPPRHCDRKKHLSEHTDGGSSSWSAGIKDCEANAAPLTVHQEVHEPHTRSLTLAQVRQCLVDAREWLSKRGHCWQDARWASLKRKDATSDYTQGRRSPEPGSFLYDKIISDAKGAPGQSYHLALRGSEGRSQIYFTFSWRVRLDVFSRAIEWLAEARSLPDTATLWVYPLALNLFSNEEELPEMWGRAHSEAQTHTYILDERENLDIIAAPMCDIAASREMGKALDIATHSGLLSFQSPFSNGSFEYGKFPPRLATGLLCMHIGNLTSYGGWERKLRTMLPPGSPKCARFEQWLRTTVAGPVLREAARFGLVIETDTCDSTGMSRMQSQESDLLLSLEDVMSLCPQLRISPALNGALCETALHLAAARSHRDAVEWMHRHGAAINAQDSDGETPLHYAAFAADADIARLLLRLGADARIESYSGETPLAVARQRPACFVPSPARTQPPPKGVAVSLPIESTQEPELSVLPTSRDYAEVISVLEMAEARQEEWALLTAIPIKSKGQRR